jgi:hypothetical protein
MPISAKQKTSKAELSLLKAVIVRWMKVLADRIERELQIGEWKHCAVGPVTREEIAPYAYYIWQKEGRPEGRALEHWLQAELQLRTARILDAPRPQI